MWVCIFASFLCLHSAGRGAILFKCRADGGGRGELGFSAGLLWPLSTWCCSTNRDIYRDLEIVPRVMLESAFSKASMVLKFLFKTAGTGKGVVAHSFRTTFHLQKGSLVLYQIGKQFEICSGFWIIDVQSLQKPMNPSHLSFYVIRSEWFLTPKRRSWTVLVKF